MRAILTGHGRMGRMVEEVLLSRGHEIAGIRDESAGLCLPEGVRADIAFDFSHRSALEGTLRIARELHIPCVIGTTALTEEDMRSILEASRAVPVACSSNYSLGVAVMKKAASLLASYLLPEWDAEICEAHHRGKKDAPSGTALAILRAVDPEGAFTPVYGRSGGNCPRGKEIGMHSLRGGTNPGVHTLTLFGADESISLTHTAESRRVFAVGAVAAGERLLRRGPGLYTPDDLL